MSIQAFYRTWLPFVAEYQYFNMGRTETYLTPASYVKGNVQPTKQGTTLNPVTGGFVFEDTVIVYIKKLPEYDISGIPVVAEGVERVNTYVFLNGVWYAILGQQDWTKANRAVKHYKLFLKTVDPQALPDDLIEPIPFAELVDNFAEAVRELDNTTNLL